MFDEFLHESFSKYYKYPVPWRRRANKPAAQEECDSRVLHAGSKDNTPEIGDEPLGEKGSREGEQTPKKQKTQKLQNRARFRSAGPSSSEHDQPDTDDSMKIKKLLHKMGVLEGANVGGDNSLGGQPKKDGASESVNTSGMRYANCLSTMLLLFYAYCARTFLSPALPTQQL
jgi:hypothetical protein